MLCCGHWSQISSLAALVDIFEVFNRVGAEEASCEVQTVLNMPEASIAGIVKGRVTGLSARRGKLNS